MEALHSRLTSGEQSGGQEHSQPESPHKGPRPKSPSQHRRQQQTGSQKPHDTLQQPKQSRRQHPGRKRLRQQRQSIDSDTALEGKHADAPTVTEKNTVPCLSPEAPASSASGPTQSKQEAPEDTPKQKRERKPQRPGKYVCTYCGRACAKPSVLQKHIRSHTGERPYPCAPCGFSFKTKSNLYKHRKSHTHRVKAGLAFGEPRSLEEQVTESEDETRQISSASSSVERQGSVASLKSHDTDMPKDHSGGMDDSYAVKKRLAMRLSRGKHGPLGSSDEKTSSLILGSRGSTESGYFSRSESTEQSHDSPPNTSAKSYAEIILGKYGRFGQLQRMSRPHNQQPSGQEEKSIPFTVPKKQVIDHITKLITINEAVVDTSKIDSVKPRRFSLSRKSSTESQKGSSMKEPVIHSPKTGDLGYKNSGSITMGVPCEKFHHQSPPAGQTSTAPLLRSHSMPSAASSFDASSGSPGRFRQSQSFDERQPSEMQASRRYRMLRRQPAIEIPLGAELPKEEHHGCHSFYHDSITTVPDHTQPQPYECEACGIGCKDWEGYKTHKHSVCLAHHPVNASEVAISQMERPPPMNHPVRPGASAMRKRRKEESFEFDDPSSPVTSSSPCAAFSSGPCRDDSSVAYESPRRLTLQTCSVIQHTSSFEKQETLCTENQGSKAAKNSPTHEEYQPVPQKQPQQQLTKPTPRKLVRQHNVQVPEILVTEDMNTESLTEPTSTSKQSEKLEEFQWPQRSPSLAQLPIEKLPPKKKRLRLAEAAQSSRESSVDSISLPRSPSQDSSASYASSRSTSFEESNRLDMETATSTTPLRRSRAPHMLTVPGVHQHREMRRSASEQAPHDPQQSILMAETRSKSFDYSCLSPERSAVGWRERRKCLLMRHSAVRDPEEEEEEEPSTKPSPSPDLVSPSTSSRASSSAVHCSRPPSSPLSGDKVLCNPTRSPCKEIFSQWKPSQNIQLTGSAEHPLTHGPTVDPLKEEASPILTGQPLGVSLQLPQPYATQGPSGAARAHYLPMSTGLKLEIPSQRHNEYCGVRMSPSHIQHCLPNITTSPELLRPTASPAVAVRLQTDTLTPACAIYTTLSQTTRPSSQEPVDAVSHNIPKPEYRSYRDIGPDLQGWSEDGLRSSSSGCNKRMLSPSNSIELSPESLQLQKRVKEEEEREERCVNEASAETSNKEHKQESQSCLLSVCPPVGHSGPSFPSLQSSTCNSWCYLNYIKPNPHAVEEREPSVYSSWSISGYDPNPPGLSSKTALSLLHCKQRLSPYIYTMSPMSDSTTEPENNRRPCSTEVHDSQSYDRDHAGTREGQQSADDRPNKGREEEEEDQKKQAEEEEEAQSSSKYKQPPKVCEGRSNERRGLTHGGGGGGGKYECEDCGFHSVLQKHTGLHAGSTPHKCKRCNFAFEAEGNLSKRTRPKSHGDKRDEEARCSPDDGDEGVCEGCSVHPDEPKHHQFSGLEESEAADNNNNNKEGDNDEDKESKSADSPHTASSHRQKPTTRPGGQVEEPEALKDPAGARTALFTRRHLQPPAPSAPSPGSESSPRSPSSLSPSGCHASAASLPRPGPSPSGVHSRVSRSPGLPGSSAGTSHAGLHPRDPPRLCADEAGPSHFTALPRGAHSVLSHLPLHSQHPARTPSLMIPIGGIHMIQPRSTPPPYSLASGTTTPTPANPCPAGTNRLSEAPPAAAARFSLLRRQDTLKETGASCSRTGLRGDCSEVKGGKSGTSLQLACLPPAGLPLASLPPGQCSHRETKPSQAKASDLHHESTDVTKRCVYPETAQGQKAPSAQTQL
ncbi:transcription factor HIVEP3 [Diretmus argenteus]